MNPPRRLFPLSVRPLLLLAGLTLAGWMATALWPRVLATLGITDYGQWFLDSYAVLAASDAVRTGVDPGAVNPLDPLLRNHKYSDWWFGLRWFGLTRDHNFVVGTVWVGAFALAVWQSVRPRSLREAGWLTVLLLSPPVLLAVNRANNDLVIYALLTVTGVAAAGATWGRQMLAIGALALATGLKFYPAPAALAFLWVRPVRRVPLVVLCALAAAGVTLASVWLQVARGQFPVESGLHTFGASLLGRELGWSDPASLAVSLLGLTLGALVLTVTRCTAGLAEQGELRERLPAALGVIVLLACFVAGVSYSYRWIFVLGMALWLWRQAGDRTADPRRRGTARLGVALLLFCSWADGALCLVVNLGLMRVTQSEVDVLQGTWRLWTQPLHWLLMMLFAGWLLEAAMATWRDWRADVVRG